MNESSISFGPYRLLAAQRLLLEGGTPVGIGSRAFDILDAPVERVSEVVAKEELIARAWPQTVVEEANLKIQVSALRRAIGDDKTAVATSSASRAGATISSPLLAAGSHRRPRFPRQSRGRRCIICRSRQRE